MRKMLKNISRKAMSIMMAMAILLSIFAPLSVYAVNFDDGNKLTLGGNPTINGTTLEYEHGEVTVSKNGTLQNSGSIDLSESDEIEIKLIPDKGYQARLHNDVDKYDLRLEDNTYTFTIGHADPKTISLTPLFNPEGEPGPEQKTLKFDFVLNGVEFKDWEGEDLIVPDNFNMDKITEFYIKKIVVNGENGTETYNYNDNEYSYSLLDNQGRRILETTFEKVSDNNARQL